MPREKLIEALEEQLQLEMESARKLRTEQKVIDHLGIKAFFEICAADSTKHASLIQMMLKYLKDKRLSEETFVSTWQQRHKGLEAIKEHIDREKQMISRLKDQALLVKDPIIKALLKHMLADEERHHEILKKEIWEI